MKTLTKYQIIVLWDAVDKEIIAFRKKLHSRKYGSDYDESFISKLTALRHLKQKILSLKIVIQYLAILHN